jgi:hypothetical protein
MSKSMFSKLDDLKWHDGVLLELRQKFPEGKRSPSTLLLTVSLYRGQETRKRTMYCLTFSDVRRTTHVIDTTELAENAVAGNIIDAGWSKKKGKAQHFIMQLYEGYIEIVSTRVTICQPCASANGALRRR